jgi:glycosyltransferase involved in cell wall biosynthesis
LFVDDGSTDSSWEIIENSSKNDSQIKGIKLSRNFGHQNALFAGLMYVSSFVDCAVTIDADLQQDENTIPVFIDFFKHGFDIVFGARQDRSADNFLKKITALMFYSLMKLFGVSLILRNADFNLLSKNVINALLDYSEVNLFLRGILPSLGFKSISVSYKVSPRIAGKIKYSWRRMFSLALNAITSFSVVPIRLIALLGIIVTFFSVCMIFYVLYSYFFLKAVPGWASTVLPIYLLGGMQILSIAIMGEYLGKVYLETKRRPRYIIEKSAGEIKNE